MEKNDIEKIMALSSILGGGTTNSDVTKATAESESKTRRQIKTLNNIIPFLEPEMKRGVYTVIKIMEIAEFESSQAVISAQKKTDFDRKKFMEAAQQYLLPEEKRLFNTLCALSQFKDMGMIMRR